MFPSVHHLSPARRVVAPHTQKNHVPLPRHSERSEESVLPSLAPSLRELPPQAAEGVFLFRTKTGDADSSALRPQNDVGERSVLPFVGRDDSARPLRG